MLRIVSHSLTYDSLDSREYYFRETLTESTLSQDTYVLKVPLSAHFLKDIVIRVGNASGDPDKLFQKVSLSVDGKTIDSYDFWRPKLFRKLFKDDSRLVSGNSWWLPIHFWFCESNHCGLPLYLLNNVTITFCLSDVVGVSLDAYMKMVYLSDTALTALKLRKPQYLIRRLQTFEFNLISERFSRMFLKMFEPIEKIYLSAFYLTSKKTGILSESLQYVDTVTWPNVPELTLATVPDLPAYFVSDSDFNATATDGIGSVVNLIQYVESNGSGKLYVSNLTESTSDTAEITNGSIVSMGQVIWQQIDFLEEQDKIQCIAFNNNFQMHQPTGFLYTGNVEFTLNFKVAEWELCQTCQVSFQTINILEPTATKKVRF